MKTGDTVILLAYGGEEIERVVVAQAEGIVAVSTSREIAAAHAERRSPRTVGFPVSDVLTRGAGAARTGQS